LTPAGGAPLSLEWQGDKEKRYLHGVQDQVIPINVRPEDSGWVLQITAPAAAADLDNIQEILIVARYTFDVGVKI
jgi:hypothetical protein